MLVSKIFHSANHGIIISTAQITVPLTNGSLQKTWRRYWLTDWQEDGKKPGKWPRHSNSVLQALKSSTQSTSFSFVPLVGAAAMTPNFILNDEKVTVRLKGAEYVCLKLAQHPSTIRNSF